MAVTSSSADIELINGSVVVPLMLARPLADDGMTPIDAGPLTIQEALVASGAGADLAEWLQPVILDDWFPGIGMAYDAAPGCDTFSSPGYVLPGGAALESTLPASGMSDTPLIAFAEYDGSVWVAQRGDGTANTARVLESTDAGATFANSLQLGASEYLKDLLVARNGSGAERLYAFSGSVTGDSGRLHEFDGASWVSTPAPPGAGSFGTANGRNRAVKVYWEGEDGVGDWRIVTLSSNQGHISYTRPGGDPMTPADWVELVAVGGGEGIQDLVSAARHVWMHSARNLYDLDELGNSPALTSYTPIHPGNIGAVLYHDGFVYRSLGSGLDRVRVDQGPILQSVPGFCSPGWATRAKSGWLTGYTTALATYLGGLLNATYSPSMGRAGVFWGVPREVVGIETPNPLVWHGPFAHTSAEVVVTRMLVATLDAAPVLTKLFLATWPTSQSDPPKLHYISLPAPGGAMQGLQVGAGHIFADGAGAGLWQPYSRLEGLAMSVGDKASVKHIHEISVGSRGLGDPVGTKLTAYVRADPSPLSTAWGTGTDILSGPSADITPQTTQGNSLEVRLDFFSPDGDASPPKPAILDELRMTFWRTAPDLDTTTYDIEYGPGIVNLHGGHWPNQSRDVDYYDEAILDMCRGGRVILRKRDNSRRIVKLRHFYTRRSSLHDGPYGKTVTGRIVVADLGPA